MTSKPHRLSACHRHPTIPVTGFCASCLRERLAGIDSPADDSRPPPHHRRTKSCFVNRDALPAEPRRRSCEVRARSTLSDLFSLDDEKKKGPNRKLEVEIGREAHGDENEAAIRVSDGGDEVEEEETKTMKEFIDLELQNGKNLRRDSKSFWDAASVVSEKLRKWRWKHKLKKKRNGNGGVGLLGLEVEKPRGRIRRLRETQSEVGDCGLGRRSCDTDTSRISVDYDYDSRCSLDAPRASWDGCLIGNKACNRLSPMVSVVDDENQRVLVEGNDNVGSSRHYSCRRSFDRSNSHRRQSIAEVDELKVISNNAKVSELFYGAKLLISEEDLRDTTKMKSLSDSVMGSASKDAAADISQKGFHKWRKVWNKLGLVLQRREDKLGDIVNKPLAAESWQKLRRRVVTVQGSESVSVSKKLIRSYSVSSCRNPCRMAGFINRLGASEAKGNVLNGRHEFMLQRKRSVRCSPNNLDTGLLRFYLTPLKSYRRSKSGKSSLRDLRPIARSVL